MFDADPKKSFLKDHHRFHFINLGIFNKYIYVIE